MRSGGKLDPHMHDTGWLTGSVYINVPSRSEPHSGSLVFLDDKKIDFREGMGEGTVIDVETASMCLFPNTIIIPFHLKEKMSA